MLIILQSKDDHGASLLQLFM